MLFSPQCLRYIQALRYCIVLFRFAVKYLNVQTRIAIIRVSRDHYKTLLSVLSLVTKLNDVSCSIKVLHLGGKLGTDDGDYSLFLFPHLP